MFETQKIDTFFSGDKSLLDKDEEVFISKRTKVVRFFKLFLPCLTAMLLGVGVVLFSFDSTQSGLSMTKEDKAYFEKFKMNNSVFEITKEDNQFSILKAKVVEEKEAGSKVYDLISPDAKTLDNEKTITLKSKNGSYNQNKEELFLVGDVVSDYDGKMLIKTNSATYNFKTEKGFGKEKIIGNGENRNFEADEFSFDKKNNVLTLIKNVSISDNDINLTTPEKATLYLNQNKFVATKALTKKGKDTVYGDTLTVFFKDTKNFEILKAISNGNTRIVSNNKTALADRGEYIADKKKIFLYDNVKVKDGSGYNAIAKKGIYDIVKDNFTLENEVKILKNDNTAFTDKAIYYQKKGEFHFLGKVKIIQKDTTVTAEKGIYYIKKNIVELIDNVVIVKDGNMVRGDKAISDFNTSKSKLIAKNGGRISGKLIESKLKN